LSIAAPPTSISATAAIEDAVRAALREASELRLRAVVLTGSLARDEGTWSWCGGRARLIGDAEFMVVLEERASLPAATWLAQLVRRVEARLRARSIDAEVGLTPVRPEYFKGLRPHMFAYELLLHGKVIWGDDGILELIPSFSASDIPFEDAFRTLLNRLIELLEAICEAKRLEPLMEIVRYRAAKLLLDMAASFLIFERQYQPTYRGRGARLAQLAAAAATAPIPLNRFAEQVCRASQYKLGESQRSPIETGQDLLKLIDDVHSLWVWELERLVAANTGLSDRELLRRWLREQGVVERLHGWASLAKRHGMLASVSSLAYWIGKVFRGSPRRLIYAAASELFFALPTAIDPDAPVREMQGWSKPHWRLPVMDGAAKTRCWRDYARAVARNYHCFLESARS